MSINNITNQYKYWLLYIVTVIIGIRTMAAIISALDSHVPRNTGENGHIQYDNASIENTQEAMVQFDFQCVRTKNQSDQSKLLHKLLQTLYVPTKTVVENKTNISNLKLLFAHIGQVRDVIDGKGEYSLAYMMILTWYAFFPKLAVFALKSFVNDDIHRIPDQETQTQTKTSEHPYGSWKDIKYICTYVKDQTKDPHHPLIASAIDIMNDQIRTDVQKTDNASLTLAGKWVARQGNTKFGWLFNKQADRYFPEYISSANTVAVEKRKEAQRKASLKARTEFRKICSALNKRLDTIQVKQCANTWSAIDHAKTTSITITKQKKALMNVTKKGDQRSESEDRVQCAENFKTYIDTLNKTGKEVKGARVGMADFTKSGLAMNNSYIKSESERMETDILNSQWRDNSNLTQNLGNMIAMVDTSGSMSGDPLHVALALGIRIAEKSLLGKRILTFNDNPRWVSLEGRNTFTDMLQTANYADWGGSTNFYKALDLILTAIDESPIVTVEDCENMTLVILSDMQMNEGDRGWNSLYAGIKAKYAQIGNAKFGKTIRPPHILFWNLRHTTGFPSLSSQPNASMMSGFSPALLNMFCEKGVEALQSTTPWSMFKEALERPRYAVLRDQFNEYI